MENRIYIKDENGNEVEMEIFFTFENGDDRYVIVHDAETDDYFSFGYDENGNLRPIEDPEEFAIVEEVFNTFVGDKDEEGL